MKPRYKKPEVAKEFIGHLQGVNGASYDIWLSHSASHYVYVWGERGWDYDSLHEDTLRRIHAHTSTNEFVNSMVALIDSESDPSISPMAYQ